MELIPSGSRPSVAANPDYFTGEVWQQPILLSEDMEVQSLVVTFAPGARTAWHTHPHGQILHILSGAGRVQSRGGPVRIIRPGDTVWFAPGEEHWHGAAPDTLMSHIAIQRAEGGSYADWLEQVSDADYTTPPIS
ncbi:MAG: cupin domain-containing protein [Pseudomonadota bacterium]